VCQTFIKCDLPEERLLLTDDGPEENMKVMRDDIHAIVLGLYSRNV
jgi:hypothetical protein